MLTIALIHNLKPAEPQLTDEFSEYDSLATVSAIAGGLRALGHTVLTVEADRRLVRWLVAHPVDLVFNIAEGAASANREAHVPAVLDLLGIPYTGSDSLTMALALDKAKTKSILQVEHIPTPRFQVFRTGYEPLHEALRFPLIVKPNREGSAKGIVRDSVTWQRDALYRQIRVTHERYRHEVLVEEFIDGTELTVGVLGDAPPRVLPILEIDFSLCRTSGEYFYSWPVKEFQGHAAHGFTPQFFCPARLEADQVRVIEHLALRAHQVLGCRGLSRTDIRLSRDGIPYVLEVNPLPGLDPVESNFPQMTRAAGLSFSEVLDIMVQSACRRHHAAEMRA